jgi:hypothetical protein
MRSSASGDYDDKSCGTLTEGPQSLVTPLLRVDSGASCAHVDVAIRETDAFATEKLFVLAFMARD